LENRATVNAKETRPCLLLRGRRSSRPTRSRGPASSPPYRTIPWMGNLQGGRRSVSPGKVSFQKAASEECPSRELQQASISSTSDSSPLDLYQGIGMRKRIRLMLCLDSNITRVYGAKACCGRTTYAARGRRSETERR